LAAAPAVIDLDVLADGPTELLETLDKRRKASLCFRTGHQHTDALRRTLLRARRERPRCHRTAECSQQFPSSDGDCHTPLPCEVRKGNDTTPRVCSLKEAGCWLLRPQSSASTALLPPPALSERGHRGLARRLVADVRSSCLGNAKARASSSPNDLVASLRNQQEFVLCFGSCIEVHLIRASQVENGQA